MSNDSSFDDAKRLYLEQYGDPMVSNSYLKIALVFLALVALSLGLIDMRTIRTFQNFRPLVIRIDQLGRAEALAYSNFEYKPQDAEVRYFLSQFCQHYRPQRTKAHALYRQFRVFLQEPGPERPHSHQPARPDHHLLS
jgi:type IV secretory pathway TrbF-like protein